MKGKNREPGRLIWNLEAADVKGEFERLKTVGELMSPMPVPA